MPRTILTLIVLGWATSFAATPVHAEEGFLRRLLPFRFFRSAPAEANHERSAERLRTRLYERGWDDAMIDERLEEVSAAVSKQGMPPENRARHQPSLEEIRAKLEQRGIDTATIEEQVAERVSHRGDGLRRSAENQNRQQGPMSVENLRQRHQEHGLGNSDIPARLSRLETVQQQHQAGKMNGVNHAAAAAHQGLQQRAANLERVRNTQRR